jgi:predicted transcriptional regulator
LISLSEPVSEIDILIVLLMGHVSMNPGGAGGPTEDLLEDVVRRRTVFEALLGGQCHRRELERRLGTSKTTVHRIVTRFKDQELLTETDEGLALTPLGRHVGSELQEFARAVEDAYRLAPLVSAVEPTPFEFDVTLFADAEVTEATSENPYRPINRLVDLVRGTDTLRGAYKIVPNPMFVEQLIDGVERNDRTVIVYEKSAVAEIVDEYPEETESLLGDDDVTACVAEGLPFGVCLLDERALLLAYDEDSGMVRLLVSTSNPEAVAWVERVFDSYREDARVVTSPP